MEEICEGVYELKKMNKKLVVACILSVLCTGFTTAYAAEKENAKAGELQSFALDEYVVTANRTEQTIFNANANISVITKDDIQRMHYDTLDKALTAVPGVQFQNYNGGMLNAYMTAPVMINGSKNVLILVDGVRMTPIGGGDRSVNANFLNNLDNVERIEVLKGSAGVLYGSDAAGGVINIITKRIDEDKTTLKASGGSFDKESYHFSNSGTDNDFGWHVYYDKDRQGDFEDGNGKEWENKWDSHAAGIKLEQKIADKHLFTFKYDESSADYGSRNLPSYNSTLQRGDMEFQETVISHKWSFDDDTTNVLTYRTGRSMVAFQEQQKVFWPKPSTSWGNFVGPSYKTRTISEQFTKRFDDRHTLIAGFDINKTIAGSWSASANRNDTHVLWGGEVKNNSYYIQDKWTFDDKWNVTAGIRYDDAEAEFEGESGNMDNNVSTSFNVGHNFDDKNNMYIGYDEYFIIPTASELYDKQYGNKDLSPAKGKNYGIGYNHIFDNNTNLSVHGFIRKADVSIGLAGSDNSNAQYSNYENSKDIGVDVQLNKRFDEKWSSFVGYSFLKHTSDDNYWVDKIKLGYLPRHAVNLGVNYNYDKWDIGLTARGFLSRDDGEAAGSSTDKTFKPNWPNSNYWIVNIGANYQATKNVKLFASANNIFDTYYAESTWQGARGTVNDVYAMPGRSFVIGAEVSF